MKEIQDRLPKDALAQIDRLSLESESEMQLKLEDLFDRVGKRLMENGIQFDPEKSSFRLKTQKRIQDKIDRRGPDDLVLDKYGLRFIFHRAKDKYKAQRIIKHYYIVPESFKGKPAIRDYSKKGVRDIHRQRFNPNVTDGYTALHMNILFGKWESPDPAEVQLMTVREFDRAEKSREAYLIAQKKNGFSHSK